MINYSSLIFKGGLNGSLKNAMAFLELLSKIFVAYSAEKLHKILKINSVIKVRWKAAHIDDENKLSS